MSMILVIAAHPDDEVLGVGGTIARRTAEGDTAYALILGEGQTSRFETRCQAQPDVIESLRRDSVAASKILGYKDIYLGDFPDNRFDSVDLLEIVKFVEKYIEILKPEIIFTHFGRDLNIDHQITNKAVLTAARPQGNYTVKQILAFETVSSTEWNFGSGQGFSPNIFIDIKGYFQIKCNAMEKYKSELRAYPHPRSIEMLRFAARRWGGVIAKEYAEAFELLRMVE